MRRVSPSHHIEDQIANKRSGYTSLPPSTISPTSVSVSFIPPPTATNTTPLKLLTNGEPEPSIDEDRAAEILKEEDLEVEIDLGNGAEVAEVWTCDFSHVSLQQRNHLLC
jgi:glutamate N-acetyltransferase/amino-acid N-acetyltransferase